MEEFIDKRFVGAIQKIAFGLMAFFIDNLDNIKVIKLM